MLGLGLVVGMPSPAYAGWTDHVAYKRQGSVCKSDGTNVVIGASVFQKEFGKKGVTQFRVKFLLYNTDPSSPGIHQSYARKTKQSGKFPNDGRNYWWGAKQGATQTWTVGPGSWWMVAKLTWVRPRNKDWNYKLPVAKCSWSTPRMGAQP